MTAEGLYALGGLLCVVSWSLAITANHEFARYDRLPVQWGFIKDTQKLDKRVTAIFRPPTLITLAVASVLGWFAFSSITNLNAFYAGLIGPGVGVVFSQLRQWRAWRLADAWPSELQL